LKLNLERVEVDEVTFGQENSFDDGLLTIDKKELLDEIEHDHRITSLNAEIVRPGESVRVMPVKDVVEPRVKVDENGLFPGFIGEEDQAGAGTTRVLSGMTVMTTGNVVGFQEGIIDMRGPGAEYTPFSETINVVLTCEVEEGTEEHIHEEILRILGLKAAHYIGQIGLEAEPDSSESFEYESISEAAKDGDDLPLVGYVYMLQSQGLLHDTYVYGVDAKEILPTLISPTKVMDGAIVSGNCVSACDKNSTFMHQNNPVIEELYRRDGEDFNFVGTIITNENVTLGDKERSSTLVAELAENLGLDAAIVSEEGFGNPDTDLILNCKKLENRGIQTVLITDEYAGRDGSSQSLADASPEADAVVTSGNANEVVELPPLERVIGHQRYADSIAGGFEGSLQDDGSIKVELQAITGSTDELGYTRLSAKGY